STDVSKIPPITQQTEHLQTSAINFSETNEVCIDKQASSSLSNRRRG
ncbi:unnamed protein product, partial [Brassica rapa]